MAQPPDISDTFLREVDENLRRDQTARFRQEIWAWLIAGVVLFLAAGGGFIYWQQLQVSSSPKSRSSSWPRRLRTSAPASSAAAPAAARRLVRQPQQGRSRLGLFARAAVALQQNDTKLAIANYSEIAGASGLPAALSRRRADPPDRAGVRFDQARRGDRPHRPLAQPGNPWFGSAGEMTAMALIKQGKNDRGGQLFGKMARDKRSPTAFRARSVQIASTLGVDASSAMPQPPAQ